MRVQKAKIKLPEGFLVSAFNCGLKKDKKDLGLIYAPEGFQAVGFFTKNKNVSYSVTFSKKNLAKNRIFKALLANSGNANCFSHKKGFADTAKLAHFLSVGLSIQKKEVLLASTGIIGRVLPVNKIRKKLPKLISALGKSKIADFASSIMTTDTIPKVSYRSCGGVNILGFAKGAGMINPNMATMLSFILTDAKISRRQLKDIAFKALEDSFNSITVDGCMSTNDSVFVLSSQKRKISSLNDFSFRLKEVFVELAKMIVKDGEGATKFIAITVKGAKTKKEAKTAGLAIANSNLFKCAVYGRNSNWGRIVAALGQAGIKVEEEKLKIKSSPLKKKDIKIEVDLQRGKFSHTVYTSDLTPQYIKINAEYS